MEQVGWFVRHGYFGHAMQPLGNVESVTMANRILEGAMESWVFLDISLQHFTVQTPKQQMG